MGKEIKPLNVEIGKRVRFYRQQAALTREQLAERVGISVRFLADIESGNVGMSMGTLKGLCGALQVSADTLLFGEAAGVDALLRGLDGDTVGGIRELVQLQLRLLKR